MVLSETFYEKWTEIVQQHTAMEIGGALQRHNHRNRAFSNVQQKDLFEKAIWCFHKGLEKGGERDKIVELGTYYKTMVSDEVNSHYYNHLYKYSLKMSMTMVYGLWLRSHLTHHGSSPSGEN